MDLYSRKIISWVLSPTLESKWIVQAINKAKAIRNVKAPLIIHSDRGIQSDLRTVYIQIFTLFKFDKNLKKYNRKTTLFIVK